VAEVQVFFGVKNKYPLWGGYAMGYYIINQYLKKFKILNWNKIVKINPKKILQEFQKIS